MIAFLEVIPATEDDTKVDDFVDVDLENTDSLDNKTRFSPLFPLQKNLDQMFISDFKNKTMPDKYTPGNIFNNDWTDRNTSLHKVED